MNHVGAGIMYAAEMAPRRNRTPIASAKIDLRLTAIIAAIIAALYLTNTITGTLAIVLGIIALVFLLTSIIGFCPAYAPLKISTKGKG